MDAFIGQYDGTALGEREKDQDARPMAGVEDGFLEEHRVCTDLHGPRGPAPIGEYSLETLTPSGPRIADDTPDEGRCERADKGVQSPSAQPAV